jgi:hypothetical protein
MGHRRADPQLTQRLFACTDRHRGMRALVRVDPDHHCHHEHPPVTATQRSRSLSCTNTTSTRLPGYGPAHEFGPPGFLSRSARRRPAARFRRGPPASSPPMVTQPIPITIGRQRAPPGRKLAGLGMPSPQARISVCGRLFRFVPVSTGSSPESGLRAGGSHDGTGMKEPRGQASDRRGTGPRGPDHDRGLNRQGEDSSATWPRHDRRPAHAGMTDTLDVMFGKLHDAAAAHDGD